MIINSENYFELCSKIDTFTEKRWEVRRIINLWLHKQPYYLILKPHCIPKYKQYVSSIKKIDVSTIQKLDNWVMEILIFHFPILKKETIIIEHGNLLNIDLGSITLHSSITILDNVKRKNAYFYQIY